jgi:hypothetical protein
VVGLGALAALDAGRHAELARIGVAVSVATLALGIGAGSSTPIHVSVALLAAMLLLRRTDRLLLAPLYGAGLLLAAELAHRSAELRGQRLISGGALAARLAATLLAVGLGGAASAIVALAVTIAPGRSVALTAVGTVAVLAAFASVWLLARRRVVSSPRGSSDARPDQSRHESVPWHG